MFASFPPYLIINTSRTIDPKKLTTLEQEERLQKFGQCSTW